ncbi:MAG: hypothetical protein ABL921_02440 [Pirellula sp.]
MHETQSIRWFWLSLCFIAFVGCANPDQYPTVPVSGVVTCEGKPIANATVNFTPMADQGRPEGRRGRVALGMTDKDGRFKLTTYANDDGAIVGKHKVTVGLNVNEETGREDSRGFACKNSSKDVEVKSGVKEYKIDF